MSASDPFPIKTTTAGGTVALPWGSRVRGTFRQLVGAREFAILIFLVAISLAIGLARPTFFTVGNRLAMYGGRAAAELPHGTEHEAVMGLIMGVDRMEVVG